MTEVLHIDVAHPQAESVARAAECLRAGGLVAIPTETVYGLGVHALDRNAVRRLFAAKGRPANDPLIVHVASLDAAMPLVAEMPKNAAALAERFWPGPLTLVMRRSPVVPDEVTAGLPTVAIRVPAHPVARAILLSAAVPIAAPSANRFSRPSPTSAAHVLQDLDGRIDLVVDAGPTQVGVESTVLDLTTEPPTVLRPGAVTLEMLRDALGHVALRGNVAPGGSAPHPSPGLLARHYAPDTPLVLFRGRNAVTQLATEAERALSSGQRVVALVFDEDRREPRLQNIAVVSLGSEHNLEAVGQRLYAAIREADALGADVILARDIGGHTGLPLAIRDRLTRAAERIVDS